MFEDAAIELNVFAPASRVFCIGSAGCTAFALAAAGHKVCAVDVNSAQTAYMSARMAGGGYRRGAADRLIAFGRSLIWAHARLAEFMDMDDIATQQEYWRRRLDTKRFRWALKTLLNPATLRIAFSAQLVGSLPARMDELLRGRLESCWARFPNRANPYARALFLGEAPDEPRFAPQRLELHTAEAAAFLEQQPPGSFDGFTLSNILDATSEDFRERLLAAVKRTATPASMVVLRSFRDYTRESRPLGGLNRACEDRSMLWGTVQVATAEQL
jgi:S-adenosylmethionine:diacylglycerol 3-amino-3-carboxypropyl transferase